MQKSWQKNAIVLLITAVFLSPILNNVHALNHLSSDDDSIPCEQCDILTQSYELDLINTNDEFIENKLTIVPSTLVLFTQYNVSRDTIVLPSFLYNKPPPLS